MAFARQLVLHASATIIVVAACVVLLVPAASAAPAGARDEEQPADLVVYVPIGDAAIVEADESESAEIAKPKVAPKGGAAQQARQRVAKAADITYNAPFQKVAGTPVPLWWLLLGLLAVPLALVWRRWTARMFLSA